MKQHQLAAMKIVAADPNVDGFMSAIGAGGPSATLNHGRMFMRLKDRVGTQIERDQIIQELRPKLAQVPGINVYLQNPPLIRVGGQSDQGAVSIQPAGHGREGTVSLGADFDGQNGNSSPAFRT